MDHPSFRGAAENVGFCQAFEIAAKLIAAQAVGNVLVPVAVGTAMRMCALRKRKDVVEDLTKIEIVDKPGDSPVDRYLQKLEAVTTTTTTTATATEPPTLIQTEPQTTDDNQTDILRLDNEVQSVMERERRKCNGLLDTVIAKITDALMCEQRSKGLEQEEKIDDTRRVIINGDEAQHDRDEALQIQLEELMNEIKLSKMEGKRETLQDNTTKTESRIEKDMRDDSHRIGRRPQKTRARSVTKPKRYQCIHLRLITRKS